MIFNKLFMQYQEGKRATFGSKWMDWHGRFFLGTPADIGLGETREDLQHTYYYIAPDRIPPTNDKVAMKQWSTESILYAQFRDANAREVSRGSAYVGLALVLILVFVGASIRITGTGMNKMKEAWETRSTSDQQVGSSDTPDKGFNPDREKCFALLKKVELNQVVVLETEKPIIARCKQLTQ